MVKKFTEREEGWFRIFVAIVSGIILKVWGVLILILAVVNWLITVVSGKRSSEIAMLCEYWNTETYTYFKYLTSVSNERPFPFNDVKRIGKFSK